MWSPPIQLPKKPHFLEIAHMADIPHQRTHDRDLLTVDIVVAEWSNQLPRPSAVKLQTSSETTTGFGIADAIASDIGSHATPFNA